MKTKNHFGYLPLALFLAASLLLIAGGLSRPYKPDDMESPDIDVWYGPHQEFGMAGLAQRWVNILGNVSDSQSTVTSLRYRLNDGPPVDLRLGPDNRRLANPGDFNIEIDPAQLKVDENRLVIEAANGKGSHADSTVLITYEKHDTPLPLPYKIDWATVKNIQHVLQVVDGRWQRDASGVRPLEMGYDRMLAVGDSRWTNYVVTVPVTVHGVDLSAFQSKEGGIHGGISVDMRWIGHSDDPRRCPPPRCGWNPVGAFGKFFFKPDANNYLGLKVLEKEDTFPTIPYQFETGHTYVFKVSVRSTPQGNRYQMKVWEQGVQSEPADWMFDRTASPELDRFQPDHGAFALVAHYTDVTFGNVLVEAVK